MNDKGSKFYDEVVYSYQLNQDNKINEEKLRKLDDVDLRTKTLNRAWEIRNFEIDLYWKRALYFWGFIFLTFLAYNEGVKNVPSSLIAGVGIVFSVAWFLVNKASKFWQENWESHIDCLEDEVEGRLYKTVLKNKSELNDPLKGYHFSVSKINQSINIFIILIWVFLLLKDLSTIGYFRSWISLLLKDNNSLVVTLNIIIDILVVFITVQTIRWLWRKCRTSFKEKGEADFEPLNECDYTYFNRKVDGRNNKMSVGNKVAD